MLSGLPAFFSVIGLAMGTLDAIPWLVATWSVMVVSGYRIWRIDHPDESAQRNLARRLYVLLSSTVAIIGLYIVRANPMVLVVVLAVWLVAMVLFGLALWSISRGERDE